jgi:hypothetical protein
VCSTRQGFGEGSVGDKGAAGDRHWPISGGCGHAIARNWGVGVIDRWGPGYIATRFEPVRPGQSDSNGLNRF